LEVVLEPSSSLPTMQPFDRKADELQKLMKSTKEPCSLIAAKRLIDSDSGGVATVKSINEAYALHFAVANDQLDIAKYLIDQGADVNKKDDLGDNDAMVLVMVR